MCVRVPSLMRLCLSVALYLWFIGEQQQFRLQIALLLLLLHLVCSPSSNLIATFITVISIDICRCHSHFKWIMIKISHSLMTLRLLKRIASGRSRCFVRWFIHAACECLQHLQIYIRIGILICSAKIVKNIHREFQISMKHDNLLELLFRIAFAKIAQMTFRSFETWLIAAKIAKCIPMNAGIIFINIHSLVWCANKLWTKN